MWLRGTRLRTVMSWDPLSAALQAGESSSGVDGSPRLSIVCHCEMAGIDLDVEVFGVEYGHSIFFRISLRC